MAQAEKRLETLRISEMLKTLRIPAAPREAGEHGSKPSPLREFGHDMAVLARHPVYVLTLCGTSVYTGEHF